MFYIEDPPEETVVIPVLLIFNGELLNTANDTHTLCNNCWQTSGCTTGIDTQNMLRITIIRNIAVAGVG